MKKINNEELHTIFTKMKNNNEIEFDKLYENYKNIVYGIAFSILKNKEDSEEIVQTVFMKLFKMDTEMLPNRHEASWLYTTAKNETISFLRKKQKNIDIEDIYEIQDTENQINNSIDTIEFNKTINKLNNIEKEIVSLKIVSNLSFYEIAKLLNKPVRNCKMEVL